MQPQLGTLSKKDYMELIQNLWTPDDQRLLGLISKDIVSRPTLERPDPYLRFYIKTYWSKDGMEEVIMQVDNSLEAINSEAQENDGGNCKLDKSPEGMRLRPISFISRSTVT